MLVILVNISVRDHKTHLLNRLMGGKVSRGRYGGKSCHSIHRKERRTDKLHQASSLSSEADGKCRS